MLTAAVDHLWQSTLVALAAAAIVLALRRRGAHVRYWIWFGASMKFLIPFALLIALGEQLAPRSESRHESSWVPVARQWLEPMTTRASPSRETAVAAGTPPPAARNDVLSTQPPTAEPTAAAGVRADQPPASTTTAGTATTK